MSVRDSPHEVVFMIYDGIQALDLTGPLEVFTGANKVLESQTLRRRPYRAKVVSADGGIVESESGLGIATTTSQKAPNHIHTFVLPGGLGSAAAASDVHIVDAVHALACNADRIVTVCSGIFPLAATGLADGYKVCTHWARAQALSEQYPHLDVDADPIFVRDRNLWSSAGVTAGIDLALAIVEDDHGAEVAQVVARWLVMFLRRPGGQTQFATPIWSNRAGLQPVRSAQDMIDADPGGDHRVAILARRVNMSERHFTRRFTEQTGASPAQYIMSVRLEAARRQLETTTDNVDRIARSCGFGTPETMRRTFARRLGVSPDQYRQRFTTQWRPT